MGRKNEGDFRRIERAIEYLSSNYKAQPPLHEVAQYLGLSPTYFQRLFKEWAGVSPKQFLGYLSLSHAKKLLADQHSIMETAHEVGLSGSSRLHDLFISIEGMTPGEYKNGGSNLNINYNVVTTPFGGALIASTSKGVCHLSFLNADHTEEENLAELKEHFPKANFQKKADPLQENALKLFNEDWGDLKKIKLHLKGTSFQLKVWECLLTLPESSLVSYKDIASLLKSPNSSRAVGSAIGKNHVAFLIPCHRVIQSGGGLGGYKWGLPLKSAMIGWEAARQSRKCPHEDCDEDGE